MPYLATLKKEKKDNWSESAPRWMSSLLAHAPPLHQVEWKLAKLANNANKQTNKQTNGNENITSLCNSYIYGQKKVWPWTKSSHLWLRLTRCLQRTACLRCKKHLATDPPFFCLRGHFQCIWTVARALKCSHTGGTKTRPTRINASLCRFHFMCN